MLIKTHQYSSDWYEKFTPWVKNMPEVVAFCRMTGEYDYLMQVTVNDMKSYDNFYKQLVNSVEGLIDVTTRFAMEKIKYTTELPVYH